MPKVEILRFSFTSSRRPWVVQQQDGSSQPGVNPGCQITATPSRHSLQRGKATSDPGFNLRR